MSRIVFAVVLLLLLVAGGGFLLLGAFPPEAKVQSIQKVLPNDIGGVIAVDGMGNISMRFNTSGMARASIDSSGKVVIELGK